MNGVKMRILLIFSVILIGFVATSSAQNEPTAYKFAEFGSISQAALAEKVRDLYRQVTGNNRDQQAFIFNYGTKDAIAQRTKMITKSITFMFQDPPRVTFVDVVRRSRIRTVMWIVPPGAKPPTP